MGMNVAGLGREGGFDHVAGRAASRSFGLRRITVFGVFADGAPGGESLVFPVAGKAEIVVMVRLHQLRGAGTAMGVMTIKTMNLTSKMLASLKIDPLLVVLPGMTFRICPFSGLQGVIFGQRLAELVGLVCRLVPRIIMETSGNAGTPGMALTANFESSLKSKFSGVDDVFLPR